MPSIAHLYPPREIHDLGSADHVYQSQPASAAVMWSTLLFGLASLLAAGVLIYFKFVLEALPRKPAYWNYGVYSAIGVLIVAGLGLVLRWWIMKRQPPMYVYAFYPQGLAIRHVDKWGLIPWKRIVAFDQYLPEPIVILESGRKIPIKHNFANGNDLYVKIGQYVFEKERRLSSVFDSPPTTDFFAPRNTGQWQLPLGAGLFASAILIGSFTWETIQPTPFDYKKMTEDEVLALKDVTNMEPLAVSIKNLKAIKTDSVFSRLRYFFNRHDSKLVLIPIKDWYLIANVRTDFDSDVDIRGKLLAWTDESDFYGKKRYEAMQQVMTQYPQYKDKMLPMQLDSIVTGDDISLVLRIALGSAAVIGLILLLRYLNRLRRGTPKVVVT